tara:strand:+ start:2799 stop:3749 length:951 start_codon:yes stop_codon:yes gene_type:complete
MANVLKEDDENENDEGIVIVEDKNELSDQEDEQDDSGDERIQSTADSDGDGHDNERESIRERRRLEKLERKDRRDTAIKRDKVELDFLRKRNDDLERRVSAQEQRNHNVDLGSYDALISNAAKEAEMADRVIAKAVESGNGEDVTQAMRYRDQAMQKMQQLHYAKQQAAQQKPKFQGQQLDDMTLHYAKEFIAENPWYDSQGRDEDSAVVIAIDQSLAKDGFNPQSEEYWQELRKRTARRLPEKFKSNQESREERTPRGGPAVGSGREHAPSSTRKEIYVSPERKQALIEAGVWDDPILRMKYVKRYAEYDRANKA